MTHDGAIALVKDGKLLFCCELEKLDNNVRHARLRDFAVVARVLGENGYAMHEVDCFVLDGWSEHDESEDVNAPLFALPVRNGAAEEKLTLARYGHSVGKANVMEGVTFFNQGLDLKYNSYLHVSGHIFSAYCTSPFAASKRDSFVLVWDAGMSPQLFYYASRANKVENLGNLMPLNGNMYTLFAGFFDPFKGKDKHDLSVAGKVMAYIALGKTDPQLLEQFSTVFRLEFPALEGNSAAQADRLFAIADAFGTSGALRTADILATFHTFVERQLVHSLEEKINHFPGRARNLCFAGGCALNIKWNSAIRASATFEEVWVPPFPNDAGSAIGAACCEMMHGTPFKHLDWQVYSGPHVKPSADIPWPRTECTLKDLARLLARSKQPVVLLNGRAELGPRALGNRSILADPTDPRMKDLLNEVKEREPYRPVAPICLEEEAKEVFVPGTPDPYMLYDHLVRPEWLAKIPAVCHLDGTARLQTVNRADNAVVYDLLQEFKKLTSIPLLCNTSANYRGRGFFPDIASVIEWGRVNFIWNDNFLYYNKKAEEMVRALK